MIWWCVYIYTYVHIYKYVIDAVCSCVFHRDFRISAKNGVSIQVLGHLGISRTTLLGEVGFPRATQASGEVSHSREWCVHHWENSFCKDNTFLGSEVVMQNTKFWFWFRFWSSLFWILKVGRMKWTEQSIGGIYDSNLSFEVQQACVLESLSLGVWRLGRTGKLEEIVGDTYRCTRCKGTYLLFFAIFRFRKNNFDWKELFHLRNLQGRRGMRSHHTCAPAPCRECRWPSVRDFAISCAPGGGIRSSWSATLFCLICTTSGISWVRQDKGKIPKFLLSCGGGPVQVSVISFFTRSFMILTSECLLRWWFPVSDCPVSWRLDSLGHAAGTTSMRIVWFSWILSGSWFQNPAAET